jgi:hypothetical protein
MPFPPKLWSVSGKLSSYSKGTKQRALTFTHACGQDMHMAFAAFVHFLDISDKIQPRALTENNR